MATCNRGMRPGLRSPGVRRGFATLTGTGARRGWGLSGIDGAGPQPSRRVSGRGGAHAVPSLLPALLMDVPNSPYFGSGRGTAILEDIVSR